MKKFAKELKHKAVLCLKAIVLLLFSVSPVLGTAGLSNNALYYADTADNPYNQMANEVTVIGEGINPQDLSVALERARLAGFGEVETNNCVVYNPETNNLTECSEGELSFAQAELAQYYDNHRQFANLEDNFKLLACFGGGLGIGYSFAKIQNGKGKKAKIQFPKLGHPIWFIAGLLGSLVIFVTTCF